MSTLSKDLYQHFDAMKKVPEIINYSGNTALLDAPKISIVGTRHPIVYTQQQTLDLAQKLSSVGVVIVSGAAMGVDGIAHRGAGPNQTIAVLPCGLGYRYPRIHTALLSEIQQEGLLLSQFDHDFKQMAWSFVVRNEMVVALGDVLIVTEAALGSGSMRSVAYAQKMGKKIYTLAHRNGDSEGTMALVKSGEAEVIYDIDLFVAQYGVLKKIEDDPLLQFCQSGPTYEEALQRFGAEIALYELEGKIMIENGCVRLS